MRWCLSLAVLMCGAVQSATLELETPDGSSEFGRSVLMLPDGRVAVGDPTLRVGTDQNVGAVHLFDAAGQKLGTMLGDRPQGQFGARLKLLGDGSFLASGVYAVTKVPPGAALPAVVSAENSLVSSPLAFNLGAGGILELGDGSLVILSIAGLGAATFLRATDEVVGPVTAQNSIVGLSLGDFSFSGAFLGASQVAALPGGGYVVAVPAWDADATARNAGAVIVCPRNGCFGQLTADRALHGDALNDRVGQQIAVLPSGNVVVVSPQWDGETLQDQGAITWLSRETPLQEAVSAQNSIVGSHSEDFVSINDSDRLGITILASGDFVLTLPRWDSAGTIDVGAALRVDGATGATGEISPANAMVGRSTGDGFVMKALALRDGGYLVAMPAWRLSPTVSAAGAVALVPAQSTQVGELSETNTLHGTTSADRVGAVIAALGNGHAVVGSPFWSDGQRTEVGAITWLDASLPAVGTIDAGNSVIGATPEDHVGSRIVPLANGNFAVVSPDWGAATGGALGAATWFDGEWTDPPATVDEGNSLVGDGGSDVLGSGAIVTLANGDYVLGSRCGGRAICLSPTARSRASTARSPAAAWCPWTIRCSAARITSSAMRSRSRRTRT